MAPLFSGSLALERARAVIGDDIEFVLAGVEGLPPSRAFVVLDGLRTMFGWEAAVHLDLVEHVITDEFVRSSMN